MPHRLTPVDIEIEAGGEDSRSFENSFAFHQVDLKPYLVT